MASGALEWRQVPHEPVVLADTARLVGRTRRQTALRLLPFLFLLYIVNYLDRTSVASMRRSECLRDLG